LIAQD
jgi:hypothetical protein